MQVDAICRSGRTWGHFVGLFFFSVPVSYDTIRYDTMTLGSRSLRVGKLEFPMMTWRVTVVGKGGFKGHR